MSPQAHPVPGWHGDGHGVSGTSFKYPWRPKVTASTNVARLALASPPRPEPIPTHLPLSPPSTASARRRSSSAGSVPTPPPLAGGAAAMAMNQFHDHQHVWLRNYEHGTYLHADKNGHGVSLRSRRRSMKAAWVVHLYGDARHVLLRSAAYGRYLTGTDAEAPPGCGGFRAAQGDYDEFDEEAVRWNPVRFGPGDEIWLRRTYNDDVYGYLRGNGKFNPLHARQVSVQGIITTMMVWEVRPIPTRERIPRLPRSHRLHVSALDTSRMMMFTENGEDIDDTFQFKGRSVFRLRKELAIRLGINADNCDNLVMYVRAGAYGRFTPLVVNLPRNRQTLVITANTRANGPRYPDFTLGPEQVA